MPNRLEFRCNAGITVKIRKVSLEAFTGTVSGCHNDSLNIARSVFYLCIHLEVADSRNTIGFAAACCGMGGNNNDC
jgi:hypothetical protein